jgi:hypothetical protein
MTDALVPMVRVLDEDGKEVMRGWYFKYPRRNDNPWNRDPDEPREMVEGILRCDEGDWGMNNCFVLVQVTPPHTMEVIGEQTKRTRCAVCEYALELGTETPWCSYWSESTENDGYCYKFCFDERIENS